MTFPYLLMFTLTVFAIGINVGVFIAAFCIEERYKRKASNHIAQNKPTIPTGSYTPLTKPCPTCGRTHVPIHQPIYASTTSAPCPVTYTSTNL